MTVLNLSMLWINRLDTGQAIAAASGRDRAQAFATDLSVRTYASGRRRAISVPGEKGELTWRLVAVGQSTKDLLRSWATLAVQVRDHRGQKWFGTYEGITVGEYMRTDLYAVTFTLQTVSFDEGV